MIFCFIFIISYLKMFIKSEKVSRKDKGEIANTKVEGKGKGS